MAIYALEPAQMPRTSGNAAGAPRISGRRILADSPGRTQTGTPSLTAGPIRTWSAGFQPKVRVERAAAKQTVSNVTTLKPDWGRWTPRSSARLFSSRARENEIKRQKYGPARTAKCRGMLSRRVQALFEGDWPVGVARAVGLRPWQPYNADFAGDGAPEPFPRSPRDLRRA